MKSPIASLGLMIFGISAGMFLVFELPELLTCAQIGGGLAVIGIFIDGVI